MSLRHKLITALVFYLVCLGSALAQSPGGFTQGQTLGAQQLNNALARKCDYPCTSVNGSLLVVANPAALASTTIPNGQSRIFVAAMGSGTSTCGMDYTQGTTTPTGQYQEVFNTPSGIYWEPMFDNSPVRACQFGTVADGSFNTLTNAVGGTDNTAMIQNALDYAMRNRFSSVCLTDGNYKTTDTLQVGWGETFRTLSLVSCNLGRNAYNGLEGVQIIPTATDRPAINIQGGRVVKIAGLQITGQNWAFSNTISAPYPTTADGWLDPALVPTGSNPGGLTRWTPYAAICVDCYSGPAAPANGRTTKYPNVSYPSWTGVITQYNKDFTSDVLIEDVQIGGFAVGIVTQPNGVISGGGDGNGDWVKVVRLVCDFSVFCYSAGNTQSRNVRIDDIRFNSVFAALTNNTNGTLQGELSGPLSNWSGQNSYQWAQIGTLADGDPLEFTSGYSEVVVRLGTFGAGASFNNSVRFQGINFFQSPDVHGIIPPCLVVSAGTPLSITFNDVSFFGGFRIDNAVCGQTQGVTVGGGMMEGARSIGSGKLLTDAGLYSAVSYSGSMLVGSALSIPNASLSGILNWTIPTNAMFINASGTQTAYKMGPLVTYTDDSGNRGRYNQATTGFVDSQNNNLFKFAMGSNGGNLDLGSFVSGPTYTSCDVMQFTYLAANQASQSSNLAVGTIIYRNNSGTIWVVTAVGAPGPNYLITTRQMNNMQVDNTGACTLNTEASFNSGTALILHTTGVEVPLFLFWGDFAKGSTSVTNIQRGDGFGGNLDTYIKNGDSVWGIPAGDVGFNWPYAPNTTLSAVTNGNPGSMTLSSAALLSGRFPILPLPISGLPGVQTNAISRLPTISASGGTCAVTATPTSGNQINGTFALTGACAAGNSVTLSFAITAPTGWRCNANTTVATPVQFLKTGGTSTTAVMTPTATTGATDSVTFDCTPF